MPKHRKITRDFQVTAKCAPQASESAKPYFARRKLTLAFRKLMESSKLRGGTDSAIIISEDRDRPTE